MERRIRKILITNAVALNGGDAAILQATISILKQSFGKDLDFTVFDMAAPTSARYYPELDIRPTVYDLIEKWAARRVKPAVLALLVLAAARLRRVPLAGARLAKLLPEELRETLDLYASADLVVSSGGTYLVPHYSIKTKLYDFLLTRALKKPLVLFTQSLGPFPPQRLRPLLRRALAQATLVLVRDERSRAHLRELGVAPERVRLCADAAFALAPEAFADRALPPGGNGWRIAISVRDWPHFSQRAASDGMSRYLEAMAALVSWLVEHHSAEVTFLSTCQGIPEYWTDDSRMADDIAARLPPEIARQVRIDRSYRRPKEMIETLQGFDLTVATRMHAAILSLCAGTPVLPVSYEFKTTELFRQLGLGDAVVEIEHIDADALLRAFERSRAAWSDRAEELWSRVAEKRASAFEAGAAIRERLPARA